MSARFRFEIQKQLTHPIGLIEKVVAVAQRLIGVLVDRNGDRLDVLDATAHVASWKATKNDIVRRLNNVASTREWPRTMLAESLGPNLLKTPDP